MNNSNLEFRKIKSLNFLYEINENGTIFRNVKSKKQSKIQLDMHHSDVGYYTAFVHLGSRKNPVTKRVMIHKVVAECWLGDCPDGMEVDHIDRNPHNNDYRNLRYVDAARRERMKPVVLVKDDSPSQLFESYAACARFLADYYDGNSESFRYRLKNHRSHIKDYDVIYLNAETIHDGSTEQEIVHESDLTGDYTTAFNEGKQQEVEMRIKHFHTPRDREVAHDHSVKDKKAT